MKNLWQVIAVILFIVVFWFTKCSNSGSSKNSPEVNLQNTSEIQSYLQGKWQMAYYPQAGLTIHVRLLIDGNTIKTWSSVNDHNTQNDFTWDMNKQPEEIYTYNIGELTEGGVTRYLEWDKDGDLTLQQRAIGRIYVTKLGFCYDGRGINDFFKKGWE